MNQTVEVTEYESWKATNPFRVFRQNRGWSGKEAAVRLDVSVNTIANWEGGSSPPNEENTLAMAELMGLSREALTDQWLAWKRRRPQAA